MRQVTDIRAGWQYAECSYPEGIVIEPFFWVPTTHSSIWDGMTTAPRNTTEWENINLPHVWNKDIAATGAPRLYRKELVLENVAENHYFLSFGGVFGLARIFLNGKPICEHRGGYTRFRADLADAVEGKNEIVVFCDNTVVTDITPLSGDFAKYGGIYRETELICVGKQYFDTMYYGSEGVIVDAEADGTVKISAKVVGGLENAVIRYTVTDAEGKAAACLETTAADAVLKVENPTLWNGKQNPYLYKLTAQIVSGETVLDNVSLTIGFRGIKMTADKGFFLNGEHVVICGVAKHQDRADVGPATSEAQLEEDMALIREIGANAVRLSHYQHPQYFYDLCDKEGLLVWAEIPMLCMPDDNDDVMENAKYQLHELLMQNRHHPSIVMWGVQNEVALMGQTDQQPDKVKELHDLVKALKPDALTATANEYTVKPEQPLNGISDIQGYNLYYGWYYGVFGELADFFEDYHAKRPDSPIGISEYGVDCRLELHATHPVKQDYTEEYQNAFHEAAYPIIRDREWVWGSFIWNMFEFASPYRQFEPLMGLNRKGLVTFDRQVKKDAFYYYKAWWSNEPFVHVCERRYVNRPEEEITVKVYTNRPEVTLTVNGQVVGTKAGDKVICFENVKLQPGANEISVASGELTDSMVLQKVDKPDPSYVFVDPNAGKQARDWVKRKDDEK